MEKNLINGIGGCCGTGPEHIKALADKVAAPNKPREVRQCLFCAVQVFFLVGTTFLPVAP